MTNPTRAGRATRTRQELGRWGEDLAAQHLEATGARILSRNWRTRSGELDLVVLEPDGTLVFVEVKTRTGSGFGEPAEAVGRVKAQRIRALACQWLAAERPPGSGDLRFDVVSVLRARGEPVRLVHLRAAF